MKKILNIIDIIAGLLWIGGIIWRDFGDIPMWAQVLQGIGMVVCCGISIYNIIEYRRNKTHE